MSDLTFNCPHCQQRIEAPDEMAGMLAQCPTCQKDLQVPASTPPPLSQPSLFKRPSPSPSTFKPAARFAGPASLSCRSCGAQLDYKENSDVATCPFCGSTNFLFEPTSETDRLRDMEDGSFRVLHYEPQLSDAQVRQCIMDAVQRDPVGCLKIGDVSWKIERVIFPAWQVEAQVHCTWSGSYLEAVYHTVHRTVTRHRTERQWEKFPFNEGGQWVNKQVPYEVQEAQDVVSHQPRPINGVHDFQQELFLPAALGFSHAQLASCGFDPTNGPLNEGRPPVADGNAVARLCVSQSSAWSKACGNQMIQQEAEKQCQKSVGNAQVESVSCVVQSKRFALVYLPVALVSYGWNGKNYRHVVNLATGQHTGTWPSDYERIINEVIKEARAAKLAATQKIKATLELARTKLASIGGAKEYTKFIFLTAISGLFVFVFLFVCDEHDSGLVRFGGAAFFGIGFIMGLIGLITAPERRREAQREVAKIEAQLADERVPAWASQTDWQDLVTKHRVCLLHYFVNPPKQLQMQLDGLEQGRDVAKHRQQVRAFLDGNTGAAAETELNAVSDHVAKCLLGEARVAPLLIDDVVSSDRPFQRTSLSPAALPKPKKSSSSKGIVGALVLLGVGLVVAYNFFHSGSSQRREFEAKQSLSEPNKAPDEEKPPPKPQPIPKEALDAYNLGVDHVDAGRMTDAIAAFQQAIKAKPDFAKAWLNLGVAYGRSGQIAEAIAAYQQTIKLQPDFADAWCNLGNRYDQSGRTRDAITALREAVKIKPDFAIAWYNLGNAYGHAGQTDEAIDAFQQVTKIKPDFVEAWNNLGFAYARADRNSEAVAAFQKAIRMRPDFGDAWYGLGVAYDHSGQTGDAIAAFQQSIKIRPDAAYVWHDLCVMYIKGGQGAEARQAWQRLQALDPQLAAQMSQYLR